MKKILVLLIFESVVFLICAQGPVGPLPKSNVKPMPVGEWPTFRADNNRDGRVEATGEFKNSVNLSQSVDFSTSEAYGELSPGSNKSSVKYARGEINKADELLSLSAEWQTESKAYLDLYGDGKITAVSTMQNTKYATLFNGDANYYRIEAHDGFGVTSNVNDNVFVGIRVYKGNTDELIVEKRFPKGDFMQRPHVTVADMNNDGQKDIIITSWEGIMYLTIKEIP